MQKIIKKVTAHNVCKLEQSSKPVYYHSVNKLQTIRIQHVYKYCVIRRSFMLRKARQNAGSCCWLYVAAKLQTWYHVTWSNQSQRYTNIYTPPCSQYVLFLGHFVPVCPRGILASQCFIKGVFDFGEFCSPGVLTRQLTLTKTTLKSRS